MKKYLILTAATLLATLSTALWTGCASWGTHDESSYVSGTEASRTDVPRYRRGEAAPATSSATTAPAPRMAMTEAGSDVSLKSDLLQLTERVPAKAALGSTIMSEIAVTPLAPCANVVINGMVPEGATYVKSEPAASVDGRRLTWNFDSLDRGATQNIKVWYKADREGQLVSCATMSALPRGCVATLIGKPSLTIEKTGPALAKLGAQVGYSIVVRNTGNAVSENVVVTDMVPDGLSAASGQKTLSFTVGDLAPGQAKEIPVTLKADSRGKHCNDAEAKSSNAGEVKAQACTTVVEQLLTVDKSGPKEQYLGKTANYEITVNNPGDVSLTGVTVSDTAPAATKIVAASGASVSGNTATWQMSELKAGEKKSFGVTLATMTPGSHCNVVAVRTAEGLSGSAQACTLWKGLAGLLLQMVDTVDPIQIGEATSYVVTITNQGTADDTNVKVVVKFPAGITPLSASGDTAGTIAGSTVTFATAPRIAPKQALTWTINAKGAEAGDQRTTVGYTSDLIKTSVDKEESTHVY